MNEETIIRTAVVTGGSRGIGRAVCVQLARQGCHVVVNYCHGEAAAQETAALCRAEGVDAVAVQADVSTAEGCKTLFDAAVNAFGRVDILVNNAGVLDTGLKAIDKYLDEDAEKVIAINEVGTMQCIRAALEYMETGASIVNVASVAGYNGGGGAVYVASKAAIIGITKHTAMLLANQYIRCNAVCPGNIATPMTLSLIHI